MTRWSIVIAALAVIAIVGILAGPTILGVEPQPAVTQHDQIPDGGYLVYANMSGDRPVRVIRVGECYVAEMLRYREWLVIDRGGFFGTEASIDCGPDAKRPSP